MKICLVFIFILQFAFLHAHGQQNVPADLPKLLPKERHSFLIDPPISMNTLFYIQRSTSSALIMYETIRTDSYEINEDNPIDIYWISYDQDSARNDLNFFQRRLAYGISIESILPGSYYEMRMVSLDKKIIQVKRNEDGSVQANMKISGEMAKLKYVFIEVAKNFLIPEISYIEIFGQDLQTGLDIYERIIP
jgi:hypothetical protein